MGHGTPDWWGSEPGETTFQVQDVGELAARLGSIDTFDRRGNVVFLEDFERGTGRWILSGVGTGHEEVLSTTYVRSGAYSLKLKGGSTFDLEAIATLELPYQVEGKMGLEVHILPKTAYDYWEVYFWLYDGAHEHIFGVRYDDPNNALQYRNADGGWTNFATGIDLYAVYPPFFPLKIVVDTDLDQYMWVLFNGLEYDLAPAACDVNDLVGTASLEVTIDVISEAAANGIIYVDDVIITQNEL